MNLKTRFFLLFFICSFLSTILCASYMFYQYSRLFNTRMTDVVDNIITNAASSTKQAIENINNATYLFQTDNGSTGTVIDDIKKYSGNDSSYNYYDLYISRQNIKVICQNLLFTNPYINGVFILLPNGQDLGWANGIDLHYDYDVTHEQWYLDTIARKGRLYIGNISQKDFFIRSDKSITFSKALCDAYTGEVLGLLLIDCDPELFDLSGLNTLPDSLLLNIYKTEDTNSILYTNVDDINITAQKTLTEDLLKRKIDLEQWGITISAQINLKDLSREFQYTRTIMISTIGLLLFSMTFIYYLISVYVTKPITRLANHMHHNQTELISISGKYLKRNDEIGLLYTEYNDMIKSLNEYIQRDYQNKLITLDAQMRALEAQIDAHFLFNTLETINSIAEIEGIESISTISLSLGNMFRYSIKTQSELVTLSEELTHVKNYVSIQQIRFNNRFHITYDVAPELCHTKVLKLILQPVVENAISHGFNRCSIEGNILLKAYAERENLYIDIEDDGVGMNTRQLEKLNHLLDLEPKFTELGRRENQTQGIGLKNIHSRIQLYYGRQYGLHAESTEHVKTIIHIHIPILPKEDSHV